MPKSDRVYLEHMIQAGGKAMAIAQKAGPAGYEKDETVRLALTHLLQIIGEAARRLSPEFCARHPEIPWRDIVGMRHKVVHDYLDVDEDIVWETIDEELAPLVETLKKFLPQT